MDEICKKCNKVIIAEDLKVNLITTKNEEVLENIPFHLSCWKEHNIEQQTKAVQFFGNKQNQLMKETINNIIKN